MRVNSALGAAILCAVTCALGQGQEIRILSKESPASPVASPAAPAQAVPAQPMPGQPMPMPGQPMPGQPMPGQPMPGAKPGEAAAPSVTRRPDKPAKPGDPAELEVRPSDDGKVRFSFQGQPWPAVLEWYAKISGSSLDWQELPGDHLNLRTQRSYTIDEAGDLLNRHLLDRGFTMLRHGEVLTVANVKKLDPSLVPRKAPEDLDESLPHDFIKVSFLLRSLLAETAVEELKPMLSPNGKVFPMKATNRIEVVDAARNIREIAAVLNQEQATGAPKRVVREFKLEFRRAAEVQEMLKTLLGLDAPGVPGQPGQPGQDQAAAMQAMMVMQAQGGQPQPPQPMAAAPKIRLVVDTRENSLLVYAPADQMAIIDEAIKTLDAPSTRNGALLQNINRMQVYRLNSIDPDAIVKVLQELGDLAPGTTLKADKEHHSIIAYAALADHVTIRLLVEKLDGTGRRFEVIRLRRLDAQYVAGTIEFMMGGGDKKKRRSFNPYIEFGFSPWGYGQPQESDQANKFRVDADTENNRLVMYANEVELNEVRNLLVKLGEIPAEGSSPKTYRILDVSPEEGDELLRRLKQAWPSVGPNPLVTPPLREREDVNPPVEGPQTRVPVKPSRGNGEKPAQSKQVASVAEAASFGGLKQNASSDPVAEAARFGGLNQKSPPADRASTQAPRRTPSHPTRVLPVAQVEDEDLETAPAAAPEAPEELPQESEPTGEVPPITVTRGPDGKLVIRSQDTAALDLLEDLSLELAPPRKDYALFQLKYSSTWAYGVVLNLREFFDEDSKSDRNERRTAMMMGYGMPVGDRESSNRLSKRRPLKFIADSDSNTILVVGADPQQLKIIEELIQLYDQPPAGESKTVRKTQLFTLRYAKARIVADAIKDVYRDLLSVNDRALQEQNNNQNQNQQRPAERSYTFIYGSGDEDKPETPIKFKGLLSLGIDEISNTLIVSASEGILENVSTMIQSLEDAARPQAANLQVLTLTGKVDPTTLQKKLNKLLGQPPQQQPQQPQVPGQPMQPQNPGQQGQPAAEGVSETIIVQ